MKVDLKEAQKNLSWLLRVVENGDVVTICRRGAPVVDLVPSQGTNGEGPKFGTLRGRVVVPIQIGGSQLGEQVLDG
jgi:prevent-host-death family protein